MLFIHQLGIGKSANDWSSMQNGFPDLVSIDCKEPLWTPCAPTGQKNLCWFGSCLQTTACIQWFTELVRLKTAWCLQIWTSAVLWNSGVFTLASKASSGWYIVWYRTQSRKESFKREVYPVTFHKLTIFCSIFIL